MRLEGDKFRFQLLKIVETCHGVKLYGEGFLYTSHLQEI